MDETSPSTKKAAERRAAAAWRAAELRSSAEAQRERGTPALPQRGPRFSTVPIQYGRRTVPRGGPPLGARRHNALLRRCARATRPANAFAAGVFLAAVLVHILPDAADALGAARDDSRRCVL